MKVCKICNENKDEAQFYKQKTWVFSKCKECYKKEYVRIKKPTGFAKLAPDVQVTLRDAVHKEEIPLKHIAARFNLEYMTLRGWIRKGQLA